MPEPRGSRGVPAFLAALAIALVGLTAIMILRGPLAPGILNDRLDLAILTASMLVATAVAALDWVRAGVTHEQAVILRCAAFALLAALNAMTLAVTVVGVDEAFGLSLSEPGQLPLVAAIVSRAIAAILLVAAGWVVIKPRLRIPPRGITGLVPAAVGIGIIVALSLVQDRLPALAPPDVLAGLAADPTSSPAIGSAPLLLGIHGGIAVLFGVAAVLAYGAHRRSGRPADALLAGGLLFAAGSQVHGALHPGAYAGLVTTSDLLRLGFYGLLLLGVVADSTQDLAELRAATLEVRKLAADKYAAAGLEERARLAREIHDGLAQDLWYAKLKQTRLAQLASFSDETAQLSDEVGDAIDAALAEARNAVAALREGAEVGPILPMIERHVADFGDRFAIRAEFTAEGRPPEIGPRAKAEILRIVQEALMNIRRHADATTVRVSVRSDGDLRLVVADNGRGFRPADAPAGFGLDSMRQRAAVIGGRLVVESEPQGGTRVELSVPLGDARGETDGD